MNSETNQEVAATETAVAEAPAEIKLSKTEYDELMEAKATAGSLKREMKDLKKSLEAKPEAKEPKSDLGLLQKGYLRMSGITAEDEVELALSTAKKWGVEVDSLVDDEDFKLKLDKLRTAKANVTATSNISGGPGKTPSQTDPAYWVAKGSMPSADQVTDRKARATIMRAFMKNAGTNGKKFYND